VVGFGFSLVGFRFEDGLRTIEEAYLLTNRALIEIEVKERAKLVALESISNDNPVGAILNEEDGHYSAETIQEYVVENRVRVVQLNRQSTLLMIYHFWEKQVIFWAGHQLKPKGLISMHDAYVEFACGVGLQVDKVKLVELQCAVNLIKHGQGKTEWGDRLWEARSDLFLLEAPSDDPYDYLQLSNESVLEFLDAVRRSGPISDSDFNPRSP
jgi:hypothetical protein